MNNVDNMNYECPVPFVLQAILINNTWGTRLLELFTFLHQNFPFFRGLIYQKSIVHRCII